MELSLIRGIVPQTVFGVTAVAALVLLIGLVVGKRNRAHRMHPLIVSLIVAVAAGAVACWRHGWYPTCSWHSRSRSAGR